MRIFLLLVLFCAFVNSRPRGERSLDLEDLERLLGKISETEDEKSAALPEVEEEPEVEKKPVVNPDDDLILTHAQKVAFGLESENGDESEVEEKSAATEDKRKMIANVGAINLWQNREVLWTFDDSLPLGYSAKEKIRDAVRTLEAETCLRFPELSYSDSSRDHLLIGQQPGCWSFLGRTGGPQPVSIGQGCESPGIIIHELSHALGLYHEQMRSDRDQFIKVNHQNIMQDRTGNFVKTKSVNLAPFDENSVMMYSTHSFSTNGSPTLVALDGDLSQLFGQRQGLTFYDRLTLNKAYACDSHCRNTCRNEGFLNKNCECQCPKGFAGYSCEKMDPKFDCGELVRLNPGEKYSFSSDNYPQSSSKPANCAWLFVAPKGSYLELEIDDLDLDRDTYDCLDKLEVRFNLPGQRGLEYCETPTRRFSTYKRNENILSLFLEAKNSKSKGFTARVKAASPSACAAYPCFNDATCTDNGDPVNFVCACPRGISGLLCELVETATITADFENGLSPLTQLSSEDLDWDVRSGGTPTWGTGPDSAQEGKNYLYVEASNGANRVATVSTPLLLSTRPKILSFQYHMKGSTMGSLSVVQVFKDKSEQTVWTVNGDQGENWQQIQLTVPTAHQDYYIHFVVLTGHRYYSDIAIDNIVLKTDMSGSELLRTTVKPAAGLHKFATDFENDIEPLTNIGNFQWRTKAGSTPSSGTGPSTAFQGSQYAYFETSGPASGDSAILQTPQMDFTVENCLDFYYHMFGGEMGSLSVHIYGESSPLWSRSGDQGDQWQKAQLTIPPQSGPYSLTFVAVKGASYRSDIAMDQISFNPCNNAQKPIVATQEPTKNIYQLSQNFESDMSGFELFGDEDWLRTSRQTPSSGTGPQKAHSGDYYVYLEASSPMTTGQTSVLTTEKYFDQDICLKFCYHMHGAGMGELHVGKVSDRHFLQMWQTTGDQGNVWKCVKLNILKGESAYKVKFEGVRGNSFQSDMALDDIDIQMGVCR